MDTRLPWRIGLLGILLIAALLRLWRLDHVPYVVFDEAYYTTFATQYLDGKPFIDAHPPVARFHFAALAALGGASAAQRFPESLLPYEAFPYVLLRTGSAVAGVLLVLFIMLLTHTITGSPAAALLAGFMAALESSLVVYARLILPDTLLLLYGMAGLWCFLRKDQAIYRSRAWYSWLAGASFLFALSAGVKATGFIFPGVAFIYALWRPPLHTPDYYYVIARHVFIVPLLLLLVFTFAHWLLLDAAGPVYLDISDTPDAMFTSFRENRFYRFHPVLGRVMQRLAETLVGYLHTIGGHTTSDAPHAVASPWWMWPAMLKPMTLFEERQADVLVRALVLIGNPAVWWGGLVMLVYSLWQRLRRRQRYVSTDVLLFGYSAYLTVMALIPRPMFVYHYFPALLFMIILMASVLAQQPHFTSLRRTAAIALVIAGFLYLAPYTYGLPLSAYWTPQLPFIHIPPP